MRDEQRPTFGRCRDCKHWILKNKESFRLELEAYPRDRKPEDGWLEAVCKRIQHGVTITASGGWSGATVDSVETDANFGCAYFEEEAA
jgi:hypothetical protein